MLLKLSTASNRLALNCIIRRLHIEPKLYVPEATKPSANQIRLLQNFINTNSKILVLTGAGLSTECGIPDYRSEKVGLYARKNYKPMQYQDFIRSSNLRKRYWARSYAGWPRYSQTKPSQNHYILANWEQTGFVHWVITQNVDHLHSKAGSQKLTELHGSLYETRCLSCNSVITRNEYQRRIASLNPTWNVRDFEIATDGDVFLTDEQIKGFQVPPCSNCRDGVMMPKIIFFGDNVEKATVEFLRKKVDECDSLLVLGSSLQVFSGYRFVLAAAELKKPIAIVNIGETRGDKHATLKLNVKCGDILPVMDFTNS
ncbi:NAD-dependent protein lipoamidase sirtuin-4, mitochondrial-like isoform X2 [Watersipora subatra]|uniref:NAD-dependent protein lipoamidase sirtuin-4, mitochondrial-like isoform X2 n=1 Tax=Watersipora subatra TaxID=2589382 RepID=UPI00355C2092